MRLANVGGRAAVLVDGRLVDVERASGGRISSDPMEALARLDELPALDVPDDAPALAGAALAPPVPRPQKILGVGLNYLGHARETGAEPPSEPGIFARLPSALAGPTDEIVIPPGRTEVDWEAELVVAIGRRAKNVREEDAWAHVAGVTCGQDVSDRALQFSGLRQYTMAKSFDTYAPIGPVLVTPDELPSRDDLAIRCLLDGEEVQSSGTSDLIFSVAELVAWASRICTLEPGDLFFTGTPAGVGRSRTPPRYLAAGNVLETEIEGVGRMRNPIVAG